MNGPMLMNDPVLMNGLVLINIPVLRNGPMLTRCTGLDRVTLIVTEPWSAPFTTKAAGSRSAQPAVDWLVGWLVGWLVDPHRDSVRILLWIRISLPNLTRE